MTAQHKKYHAPPLPIKTGDGILDHYRIGKILGAVGSVWYAQAVYEFAPQIVYSIQLLPWSGKEDCPQRAAFLSEHERLQIVQTPPYVPLVRHGVTKAGHGVIVREFLHGKGLYDVRSLESFSTMWCMRVIECVARAMRMAHNKNHALHGFTHQDVIINDHETRSTSAAHILQAPYPIGTRCYDEARVYGYLSRYHAPEFLADPVASVSSDIFSIGMVMSILLFAGKHSQFLGDPYNFDFGEFEGFRALILRSMDDDVHERYSTIDEFVLAARESARDVLRMENKTAIPAQESRVFARRQPKP